VSTIVLDDEAGVRFMSAEITQAVLDHHLAALLVGDVDGLMEDYTDDSVFMSNLGGVVNGFDAIRSMFAAGADMSGWELVLAHVEGEAAFITWTVKGVVNGADTFVVRDGKIALQTAYIAFE
jgi:ketosteroid isomerase-like protein